MKLVDRGAIPRLKTPDSDPASYDLPDTAHMAHVIAHRLRGLVTGIEGYTDLLLEQLGVPEQRDLAMRVMESAHRIEQVLADLRYFTRPVEPAGEDVPPAALIVDLLETLPSEVAERVRFDVEADLVDSIHTDPYLLREALLLVLQNAVEACPEGTYSVGLRADTDCLRIAVANDGSIPEEHLDRMFEPFFTTKAQNLGVGLPMARRILRALGGTIVLDRIALESGSVCFALALPAGQTLRQ